MELPIYDARGGSFVAFARLTDDSTENLEPAMPPVCSLIVAKWEEKVLFGFNVSRRQWELPGGAVETGETAYAAAIRELSEETGIAAERVSLVASAEMKFEGDATRYRALVFTHALSSVPNLIESDELNSFAWWDPDDEIADEMSPIDAEIARRCLQLG